MTKLYFHIKKIFIISSIFILAACDSKETVFQGYVEGEYAYIASAISGNLTQRLVNRGDQVVVNQPLFVLDPQPETDKLEQAKFQLTQAKNQLFDLQKGARFTIIANIKAQLEQAQAGLDFAQETFERYQALYRSGAIDKGTLDQARSQYEQNLQAVNAVEAQLAEAKLGARENQIMAQKAAVDAAEAIVKQAEWALLQKSVRATVNAQVFDTLYEPGEFVGVGRPVIALLPPDKIKIVFFVPEKIVSRITVGDEVIVDCDSCKNSYKAKITFISPSAEFTPPVIFSQESRDKLVYRIEARTPIKLAKYFHPGQPIDVVIENLTK